MLIAEAEGGEGAPALVPTMRTFGPAFLADCAERWKPKTRVGHAHNMHRFILPAFGNRRVDAITARDVRSWFGRAVGHTGGNGEPVAGGAVVADEARREPGGLRPEGMNPCRGLRRRKTGFKAHYMTDVEFAALGWALAPGSKASIRSRSQWCASSSTPARASRRQRASVGNTSTATVRCCRTPS